jgi:hypothetical protein
VRAAAVSFVVPRNTLCVCIIEFGMCVCVLLLGC